MTPAPTDSEIWFLTGSQSLYGEETLAQVAAQSRQTAEDLAAGLAAGARARPGAEDGPDPAQGPRIVWKPVLTGADAIRRMCLDAEADDRCIGLIAWMHTFSPAKMWIAGLAALRKPLLHLHTQANRALPWSTIDMDFMNLNQAAHGDREFGHIQSRLGVARKTVTGHVRDPDTVRRIDAWTRAAVGRAEFARLRLARFGDNMRDVAVTEGDKVEAQYRLGTSVNTYGVNELVEAVEAVEDHTVLELTQRYADTYRLAPELRPGGERHTSLRYAARIEAGLRGFLAEGGFAAFTTNFEDLGGLRQLPGLAVQRLMADGHGFGGEGDWKTAALLRAAKAMAYGLPGGTSFMEDYTYDLTPESGLVLGAHMLEVCPSLTTEAPSCEIHPLSIGGREDPVRLVFDADPGPGLVVGLADMGSRFRLVANEVEVIAPPAPLPLLPVARAVWRPAPDLRTSTEAWLTAGAPHHTVLTTALGREEFEDLADMLALELAMIDTGTTVRRFAQELRWNQAYHRLADAR
ncbi:L-arabinose isomerase [Streptomyces sp. DSS69]|uniref:L-arabinose isomerase n=1 Tax=unclassified Streptomyces TaxID=2593676 RepID=UPI0031F8288B